MLSHRFYVHCLFVFGLGSLAIRNPILQRDIGDDTPSSGATLFRDIPEVTNPNDKRSENGGAGSLWGLNFSSIFSRAANASSNTTLSADETAGLNLHNAARASKGVAPLAWDPSLQAQALAYAKQLIWGTSLVHSKSDTRPNQGENLAFIGTAFIFFNTVSDPITAATKGWLAEAPYYKGEVIPQGSFSNYSHYTQCMWNTTDRVGIAAISGLLGGWWVVARYSPPGNIYTMLPY